MAIFVSQKSAIKIVIEMTTTVRVVLSPTPAVPPRVVIPKWQPTSAMIAPKNGVLKRPLKKSFNVTVPRALRKKNVAGMLN